MTHLERKMNQKQIEECKEKFVKFLKNHGDDKEDHKSFTESFCIWKERTDNGRNTHDLDWLRDMDVWN